VSIDTEPFTRPHIDAVVPFFVGRIRLHSASGPLESV
jgi:hypothetical protein